MVEIIDFESLKSKQKSEVIQKEIEEDDNPKVYRAGTIEIIIEKKKDNKC